jgi:hypothetical protein
MRPHLVIDFSPFEEDAAWEDHGGGDIREHFNVSMTAKNAYSIGDTNEETVNISFSYSSVK